MYYTHLLPALKRAPLLPELAAMPLLQVPFPCLAAKDGLSLPFHPRAQQLHPLFLANTYSSRMMQPAAQQGLFGLCSGALGLRYLQKKVA